VFTVLIMDDPVLSHSVFVGLRLQRTCRDRCDAQRHSGEHGGLEDALGAHERHADILDVESPSKDLAWQRVAMNCAEFVEELKGSSSDLGVAPDRGHHRHGGGGKGCAQAPRDRLSRSLALTLGQRRLTVVPRLGCASTASQA